MTLKISRQKGFALGCLGLLAGSVAQAISVANFSTATNNRFQNDPSFIMDAYELSGVAIASNSNRSWITMVSPNVFLTTTHLEIPNGSSVTFYAGNDSSGPSVSRTVSSSQQLTRIGNPGDTTDMQIGVLSTPLPAGYSFYNYATQDTTNNNPGGPASFNNSPYNGASAYIFGKGAGDKANPLNMTIGTNEVDRFYSSLTATINGEETTDPAMATLIGGANSLTYEAALEGGDSGAPVFVDDGGNLTLIGINWFRGGVNSEDVNGFSYIGNWDEEIDQYIAANAIPEPSPWILASLGFLAFRRRRAEVPGI
jgi:hypothetical protein